MNAGVTHQKTIGIVGAVIGTLIAPTGAMIHIAYGLGLGMLLYLVGLLIVVLALGYYARAKGRSVAWGLLGLFFVIGLLVVLLLPDRT